MAKTQTESKTVKGFNKTFTTIFNKVINGKELTARQKLQLDNYIKDLGGYREQPEQPTQTEQPKPELKLQDWGTLTQEQKQELKGTLLKSKYGIGGEHYSTFPTLLDGKENTFLEQHYNLSKLPKRVGTQTFKDWEGNGEIKILPLQIGNNINYLVILLPNKNINLDIWELTNGEHKPYTKYTTHNKVGEVTLGKEHYHITNIYTNKNKAYNQGKALLKLFKLGKATFKDLELQKELKTNYYQKDINKDGEIILKEIGKNNHTPTGKTFKDLEQLLGRKQHTQTTFNYLEHIQ